MFVFSSLSVPYTTYMVGISLWGDPTPGVEVLLQSEDREFRSRWHLTKGRN